MACRAYRWCCARPKAGSLAMLKQLCVRCAILLLALLAVVRH